MRPVDRVDGQASFPDDLAGPLTRTVSSTDGVDGAGRDPPSGCPPALLSGAPGAEVLPVSGRSPVAGAPLLPADVPCAGAPLLVGRSFPAAPASPFRLLLPLALLFPAGPPGRS